MKQRIEDMIPLAMDAIENYFQADNDQLKPIPATFQGSISSLGATLLQMGLLPTLAVFSDTSSGAKDDQRSQLLIILGNVLANYTQQKTNIYPGFAEKLAAYRTINGGNDRASICQIVARPLMSKSQQQRFQDLLMDAAVAVKLSLRTFKLEPA